MSSAQELQRQSQASREKGDSQDAFNQASRAYALVRQFPDDAACAAMAQELLQAIGELAPLADQSSKVEGLDFKTLVVE